MTTDVTDLPDELDLAGKPAAWIREDDRVAVFIRGSRREPDGSIRVQCQREGDEELLDTAWERVEVLA